ncbi:MAG: GNAT family N-acetyltransferase [Archaeoglobaceae archaeon]|nr:GNAT family N-acetyltransferase [Archaeoglobaceae archaeon]MDW7989668.1 GNAT family N-acetyltransferase [Archaeoglobaceae archaeon]
MVTILFPTFKDVIVRDKAGEEIIVRQYYHEKDREKLIEMYVNYNPNYSCLGLPPMTRTAIENWIDYLSKNGFSIIAEKDEKVVGHLVIVPDEKNRVDLMIFIHQDYQNRGLGQEMMKLIIEYCKKAGFDGIMLVTERTNARAIHVYKKLGFEIVAPYYEFDMYLQLK